MPPLLAGRFAYPSADGWHTLHSRAYRSKVALLPPIGSLGVYKDMGFLRPNPTALPYWGSTWLRREFNLASSRARSHFFLDYGWRDAAGHFYMSTSRTLPRLSISIWNCPSIETEIKLCYVVYARS
ncbi:hypothetical protein ACFE04_019619 [Oxalis oulophora]